MTLTKAPRQKGIAATCHSGLSISAQNPNPNAFCLRCFGTITSPETSLYVYVLTRFQAFLWVPYTNILRSALCFLCETHTHTPPTILFCHMLPDWSARMGRTKYVVGVVAGTGDECSSAGAAITECHMLSGLNSTRLFLHSSGGWSPRSGSRQMPVLVRLTSWRGDGCLLSVLSHGLSSVLTPGDLWCLFL